ncbi:uncharacterized protein LOC111352238 [Spodoptera litura]|uniref:Uncharacterized protein LOC111352238 n=2 Tax=Spodoptera litura TaxID=69820 RepID=A0A9J7E1W4_SPOLT|nr:uncharacterized protein LOC111352238 [Spodoptera litura]
MAGGDARWGCCESGNEANLQEKFLLCSTCGRSYHYFCISIKEPPNNISAWKCPTCMSSAPKVGRSDSTPIRNVSMNRGPKRQAIASPSPPSSSSKENDIRCIIKEIIGEELSEMLVRINETIVGTISRELEPLRLEMQGMRDSMSFMNEKFEEIRKKQEISNERIMNLEAENAELKAAMGGMSERFVNLEQQSRSNNLEVQCVPENKNENVYKIITQLARVVKCEISDKDIPHCTRVAKSNSSSTRPRSIIVQLASPKLRDQLLAATIHFNKSNPQEKLNSSHLGYAGPKSPVYVAEHLSPTNRALHAATRIKAKEMNYKYVWVRNGRIFVRKNEGTEHIQIRNNSNLSRMV